MTHLPEPRIPMETPSPSMRTSEFLSTLDSEKSLSDYRQSLVDYFLPPVSQPTRLAPDYFLRNPSDSLARRIRAVSSISELDELRKILKTHHPVVRRAVIRNVSEGYLKYMMLMRYKGNPLDLVSRAEESRALREFDVESLHCILFHGDILLPRDVMVNILSFMEYSYQMLCRIGTLDWSWFTAVLSTWPKIVVHRRWLFKYSELAMRSCREIVLKGKQDPSNWRYVWVQVGHGTRQLDRVDFGGVPSAPKVQFWVEKWSSALRALQEVVQEADRENENVDRLKGIREIVFKRLEETCWSYDDRDGLKQRQAVEDAMQGISLVKMVPQLEIIRHPPSMAICRELENLRILEAKIPKRDTMYFCENLRNLPPTLHTLQLEGLENLVNQSNVTPSVLLEPLICPSGPRRLTLLGSRGMVFPQIKDVPSRMNSLRCLHLNNFSLFGWFMQLELPRLKELVIRSHPKVEEGSMLDKLRTSFSSLRRLQLGILEGSQLSLEPVIAGRYLDFIWNPTPFEDVTINDALNGVAMSFVQDKITVRFYRPGRAGSNRLFPLLQRRVQQGADFQPFVTSVECRSMVPRVPDFARNVHRMMDRVVEANKFRSVSSSDKKLLVFARV